ncbi:nitrate reductase [Sulfurimonas lithotrophica]|uniref:Periplasmic nitrate reductase, electron transfer subunit n=1 Tax=Sulfurimonas lithotrophica TaxID=2590022 RepID=A0A5P8P2E1_9BACT|nr:nitrate reductase cytochrome c-type subunit [Sulfurimonas lithotrophica]QFR49740.1 nitrate reductase [Sulfurimonas lithotrophica]
MKIMSKITIGLFTATLLFVGCNDSATPASGNKVAPTVTEKSLGLRKTDLYSEKAETQGDKTNYSEAACGSGYKINRAFQDAPPMIPHGTEGMLPIKIGNNQCTGCHEPAVAVSMGATPIPRSHYTNFRPTHHISADGEDFSKSVDNMKNEVSIKTEDRLQGARFNCSQCHAPQSQGKLAVANNFEPDYTQNDGANKSSWNSQADFMYGIDTIKGDGGKVTADDIANKDSAAGSLDSH